MGILKSSCFPVGVCDFQLRHEKISYPDAIERKFDILLQRSSVKCMLLNLGYRFSLHLCKAAHEVRLQRRHAINGTIKTTDYKVVNMKPKQ